MLEVWVCESKSFSQGVSINEHGEWSTWRDAGTVDVDPGPPLRLRLKRTA
jgi:hypothetical protein